MTGDPRLTDPNFLRLLVYARRHRASAPSPENDRLQEECLARFREIVRDFGETQDLATAQAGLRALNAEHELLFARRRQDPQARLRDEKARAWLLQKLAVMRERLKHVDLCETDD